MGIFFPATAVGPTEYVEFETIGNLFQGRIPKPGRFTLTDRNLHFTPSRLQILRGAPVIIDRRTITAIEPVATAGLEQPQSFREAIRGRLSLQHAGGTTLLTVRNPKGLLDTLGHLAG